MKLEGYGKWINLAVMDELAANPLVINDDDFDSIVRRAKEKNYLFRPTAHYFRLTFSINGVCHHILRADKKTTRWELDLWDLASYSEADCTSYWCSLDKIEEKFNLLKKGHFKNW